MAVVDLLIKDSVRTRIESHIVYKKTSQVV